MLDPETVALLESGCSISVASVDADGAPYASRAWGIDVSPDGARIRLLLDAEDTVTIGNLTARAAVSVTGVAVPTLRAVQLKGRADGPVTVADATDVARAEQHFERFCDDVVRLEGTPVALLERIKPESYAVCIITVAEVFDQTPGPVAGARLGTG